MCIDTGISEMLVPIIHTEEFNKSLEIQQSRFCVTCLLDADGQDIDLLASYNVNEQITAIEDMIAREADFRLVVRLLCLASLTNGGIKPKVLESIKREILQVRPMPCVSDISTNPSLRLMVMRICLCYCPLQWIHWPFCSRQLLRG
jgi:hypothetical protein